MRQYGFESATQVQSHTIPEVLAGKDIFAQAKTGSGKTGSFAIPTIERILRGELKKCIILSPTRELAEQTHSFFSKIGTEVGVNSACFIGGESIDKQKKQLDKEIHAYIATPGRLVDLIRQKILNASDCSCIIFDEADRLFEMGFQKDIEFVLRGIEKNRQIIMVSATSNMEVLKVAYKFHSEPVEIKLNTDEMVVKDIDHQVAMISEEEKMPYLLNTLRKNEGVYSLVFCNTQYMTHLVALWLQQMGVKAKAISGKLNQGRRSTLMEEFRSKELMILVCTDVAARGLDIDDVNLVINYDLPQEAANYVHRIGRTGRAGKSGIAISFCGYKDCENLDDITAFLGEKLEKIEIEDEDFATDVCAKPRIDPKTMKLYDSSKKNDRKKKMSEKEFRKEKPQHTKRPHNKERNKKDSPAKKYTPDKIKYFEYESTSESTARDKALRYFKLMDETLLKSEIISKGSRKFIFFGARNIKYKFSVTPIYKRMLLPFLIGLFKKMNLAVFVRVSFKEPEVRVNISGKDIAAFKENKFALKRSVEQLVTVQLRQKIYLSSDIKISVRLDSEDRNKRKTETELLALVEKTKDKVLETQAAVIMESLNPADRRIIHQAINDDNRFESSSIGDGRFKKIEITLND